MPIMEMIAAAAKISASVGEASVVKGSEALATKIAETQTLETVVHQLEIVKDNSLEVLKAKVETEIEIYREVSISERVAEISKESAKLDEATSQIQENYINGKEAEEIAHKELSEQYPEAEGYKIDREQYLRDEQGKIVKDPITGEARRLDFVVSKDGQVIDSIEVKKGESPEKAQLEKEDRIREGGGNWIRDSSGELIRYGEGVQTRVRRMA